MFILPIAIIAVVLFSAVAFIAGRWTSAASVAQRRYSRDAGKPPLWLKTYKSNGYTRTVYEKISNYFETEKPYLQCGLTIDDVAHELGTNKSYVAKAVRVYSGRNFCQYVNAYRVNYAISLFKKDPTLRMTELSSLSGFNSPTSFSIAFKVVKNMPPGEWLRRYKK